MLGVGVTSPVLLLDELRRSPYTLLCTEQHRPVRGMRSCTSVNARPGALSYQERTRVALLSAQGQAHDVVQHMVYRVRQGLDIGQMYGQANG